MNIRVIDDVLEKYVDVRQEKGKEKAAERFLAQVYLQYGGDEVLDFLVKVSGLARYYIMSLRKMENPFKGWNLAWFVLLAQVGGYGLVQMAAAESRVLGIFLFSGALVHAWYLTRTATRKWRMIGERIVIYREIVQIIEKELAGSI